MLGASDDPPQDNHSPYFIPGATSSVRSFPDYFGNPSTGLANIHFDWHPEPHRRLKEAFKGNMTLKATSQPGDRSCTQSGQRPCLAYRKLFDRAENDRHKLTLKSVNLCLG
jgi:hypothetical protein